MSIKQVQTALAALGYTPGAIDGMWGPQTRAALKAFQKKRGLEPDGKLGPLTMAALFPNAAKSGGGSELDNPALAWFQEARRLIGVAEKEGSESNQVIIDWATKQGITYGGDDIPWCGLFVGHCISSTLEDEPTPAHLLSARSWSSFGVPTAPTVGAVMVFWRKSLGSGLGHVGFYAGEDDDAFRILGGNQSNKVSLAWVARDRLVGARWPATVPPPQPKTVTVSRTETISSSAKET